MQKLPPEAQRYGPINLSTMNPLHETPRTDKACDAFLYMDAMAAAAFLRRHAEQLERELNEAKAALDGRLKGEDLV